MAVRSQTVLDAMFNVSECCHHCGPCIHWASVGKTESQPFAWPSVFLDPFSSAFPCLIKIYPLFISRPSSRTNQTKQVNLSKCILLKSAQRENGEERDGKMSGLSEFPPFDSNQLQVWDSHFSCPPRMARSLMTSQWRKGLENFEQFYWLHLCFMAKINLPCK